MISRHDKPKSGTSLRSVAERNFVRSLVVVLALVSMTTLRADLISRELGENLRYFRAHVLPAELPAADVPPSPIILDLRYTRTEPGAANALDAWLKFRATPTTPIVVLVNSETSSEVREMITPASKRADLVTVGRKTGDVAPDIVIETTDDEERRAYDALEQSTSVESLITENADKPRVDEASIMRDRAEGNDRPFGADPRANAEKKTETPAPTLVDRALQRAIHLHRALLALQRLQD